MKSIVTTKKKLELKKTAIANLSMSEAQMRMVVGGVGATATNPTQSRKPAGNPDDETNCTSQQVVNQANTL